MERHGLSRRFERRDHSSSCQDFERRQCIRRYDLRQGLSAQDGRKDAVEELKKNKGSPFDPKIVDALVKKVERNLKRKKDQNSKH